VRRRSSESPVSFFSFQDLMTGTIGVMILIALILVLWLTEVVESVEAYVAREPTQESDELATLRSEVMTLELSFARQTMAVESITDTTEMHPDRRLAQLRLRLRTLYEEIEARKEEIAEKTAELRTMVEGEYSDESATTESRHLQQQLEQLEATLEERRRSDRLVYIASQSFALQPLLIEMSSGAIRVSGTSDAETVIEFTDEELALRLERALAWLEGFSDEEFYCLLLLKPSGLPLYEQLRAALVEKGFQIGVDLMPERFRAALDAAIGE